MSIRRPVFKYRVRDDNGTPLAVGDTVYFNPNADLTPEERKYLGTPLQVYNLSAFNGETSLSSRPNLWYVETYDSVMFRPIKRVIKRPRSNK